MHECNDLFDLFLGKPYSMLEEHLENGTSCMGSFYDIWILFFKIEEVYNSLNGQVQALFYINVFFCDPKNKIR